MSDLARNKFQYKNEDVLEKLWRRRKEGRKKRIQLVLKCLKPFKAKQSQMLVKYVLIFA